jgi:hypothetical protein
MTGVFIVHRACGFANALAGHMVRHAQAFIEVTELFPDGISGRGRQRRPAPQRPTNVVQHCDVQYHPIPSRTRSHSTAPPRSGGAGLRWRPLPVNHCENGLHIGIYVLP